MRVTIDTHVADSKALKLLRQSLRQICVMGEFIITMEDAAGELWTATGRGGELPPVLVQAERGFLPGDLVKISTDDKHCTDFNNREGVVTYGPDSESGWLVSSAPGRLRCTANELTMITPREER